MTGYSLIRQRPAAWNRRALLIVIFALQLFSVSQVCANQEIIVSAAGSLINAMTEVGKQFEETNTHVKVVFNFASSGSLVQQMIHGAPVDVFASANQKFMDKAEQEGLLLEQSRKDFARNHLVLAAPVVSMIAIERLEDLGNPDVLRIALGNPSHVPAGQYSRQALISYGLWEVLSAKYIFASNVRQVMDYLVRREVDFGLLYATDVINVEKTGVKTVLQLSGHDPIVYPISVLARTKKKELALGFVAFVMSNTGQEILSEFGFDKL